MEDVGFHMIEHKRKYTGKCVDCSSILELFELDVRKGTRIMICQNCGLLHHYKKNIVGKWKFLKATKT